MKNPLILSKFIITGTFIAASLLFTACASTPHGKPKIITTHNWHKATQQVLREYYPDAYRRLRPAFIQKGVAYPPKKVALLAFKKEKKMEVWAKDNQHKNWIYIKTFPILAASGGPGPKLKEFDLQVPEGIYKISFLNPFSQLHLSMKVNYPNHWDKAHARLENRTDLGGDIYIHGKASSAGCLSMGDPAIEDLFELGGLVGVHNIKVIIAPNDLRHEKPAKAKRNAPKWLPALYSKIKVALQPFKA